MLISFAIPTYRRAENLRRCLRSILEDDDQDIEVVVSDNASPDHTSEVVDFWRNDIRLRYTRNSENIGVRHNMLEAMRKCKGRYIFILTDDDFLRRGSMLRIRNAIQANPQAAYLISQVASVRESDGSISGVRRHFPQSRQLRPGPRAALFAGRTASILSRQIIRRDAIDFDFYERAVGNGYFPCMVAADMALHHPVAYVDEVQVWHAIGNVQHWNEFGRDWTEIYHRTHMDYLSALRDTFRWRRVGDNDCVRRWQIRAVRDYARLAPAVGIPGFLTRHGVGAGLSRLRAQGVPRDLVPFALVLALITTMVWMLRRLAGSAV